MLSKFADAYEQCYREAPWQRRAPYGDTYMNAHFAGTRQSLPDVAMDPHITVMQIIHSLVLVHPPPTRIVSGPMGNYFLKPISWLSDETRDSVLFAVLFQNIPHKWKSQIVPQPKPNTISHVTIDVSDLSLSIAFYQKLGLEPVDDEPRNGQQFLMGGGRPQNSKVLVLLRETKDAKISSTTTTSGIMPRLSIYTTTKLEEVVATLKTKGLTPIGNDILRVGENGEEKGAMAVAAYHDPDGFLIHILQTTSPMGSLFFQLTQWSSTITDPWLYHWTLNVSNFNRTQSILQHMGLQTIPPKQTTTTTSSLSSSLLAAFGIDNSSNITLQESCTMGLPDDKFLLSILQWNDAASNNNNNKIKGKKNALAFSVANAKDALANAVKAGMIVPDMKIETRELPFFGSVRVGTAYLEQLKDDGTTATTTITSPIEFVEY
eukprot:CAMPEP_0116572162 /NCGR_PEP_ID=MMETSP0397-20121206/18013_1 /TAXON_ID=216820 /ORGANISM="Cyclophora tenuis, Strain ECT3854" /LENGTH=432 /DNA_ID=CAMNT_0004100441 /DNA_START=8 /DNA_END=1306 /DNA_ORIENTATION=-